MAQRSKGEYDKEAFLESCDGAAVDRSKRDDDALLLAWLERFDAAGGLLLAISRDGFNSKPPQGWNKDGWTGGQTTGRALGRLVDGSNVGTGCTGGLFILDADNPAAVELGEEALAGAATLSAWTPRAKQYILKGDGIPQIQCPALGIDTRGSGKGYGMAPGSYRSTASYKEKWKWDTLTDAARARYRATLPSHQGPWYYRVGDIEDVAEAPRGVLELLARCKLVNAQEKERGAAEKRYSRRKWTLDDLGEMLEHLDAGGTRDEWLRIVFGAKAQFGDEAREKVEAWSQGSDKYDAANFDATWVGASAEGGTSFGTVVYEAAQAGYNAAVGAAAVAATASASGPGGLPRIRLADGYREQWAVEGAAIIVAYGNGNQEGGVYVAAGTTGSLTMVGRAVEPDPNARVKVAEGTLQRTDVRIREVCMAIDPLADWGNVHKTGKWVPKNPHPQHVEFMLTRAVVDKQLPVLTGIADGPVMRRDGTLLSKPGYDPRSGLYAGFDGTWPAVPVSPTAADAKTAGELLLDVVADTPFKSDADRGVFLSLVLSVLARDYALGGVPAHLFSANVRGSGKGTLCQIAAAISTGTLPTMLPTNDGGGGRSQRSDASVEDKKRLQTLAMTGSRMAVIDNIEAGTPFGNSAIDEALTVCTDESIGMLSDRVLGKNDASALQKAPWRTVLCATGNNMRVGGDGDRRVIMCTLESPHENPEVEADYSTHPNPVEYALKHRKQLYMAGITMLLAHHQAVAAGLASPITPRVGSFGGWSDRIRSAIAWSLGESYDPFMTNATVKSTARPEHEDAIVFLSAWRDQFGDKDVSLRKDLEPICRKESDDHDPALADAVAELQILPPRDKAAVNVRSLSKWMLERKNRPGKYIVREGGKRQTWMVEERETAVAAAPSGIEFDDSQEAAELGVSEPQATCNQPDCIVHVPVKGDWCAFHAIETNRSLGK